MPIAKANAIELWYETFGNKQDQALLLIMGGCAQGILWPTEFCEQLAQAGFFVIRYDHRDTGLSTCFDYANSPYDLMDMMQDAIGLLDYLEIKKFHLVGLSMGGPIAELLAVHHASRTLSITLIATSCDFRPLNLAFAGLPRDETLMPPPHDSYLHWMNQFMTTPPKNNHAHVEMRLEGWRILNGNVIPFEENRYRFIHQAFLERTLHPNSLINHVYACRDSEHLVRQTPAQVKTPTLIIHGTEDPILPPPHGCALASLIPHANYFLVNGMGHIPNEYFYTFIIQKIQCH